MKKLRGEAEGWRLQYPPETEDEKRIAEAAGFIQISSREWVLSGYDPRPLLETIQKNPFGHRCRACRSSFRSQHAREAFCPSCRNTMKETQERLQGILQAALDSQKGSRSEVRIILAQELECPRCDWVQNEGRLIPEDLRLVLEYLPGWIERAHRHFLHHVFWNRFPYNRRFAPEIPPADHQLIYGLNSLLNLEEDTGFGHRTAGIEGSPAS